MSMRHTELDADVQGYWFRNRLVSMSRTLAETDAACAEQTLSTLHELSAAGIDRIEIVHTGFEPAVIGFYRAVSAWIRDAARPPLFVQPLYRRGGSYLPGTPWC